MNRRQRKKQWMKDDRAFCQGLYFSLLTEVQQRPGVLDLYHRDLPVLTEDDELDITEELSSEGWIKGTRCRQIKRALLRYPCYSIIPALDS